MDLKLVETAEGYDLQATTGDLAVEEGLQTAILISLLTDAPAGDSDTLPDNSGNRGGWWHDALAAEPLGSKLWLLNRAKVSTETADSIQSYIEDALAWMQDEGIVSSIEVTVTRDTTRRNRYLVTIEGGRAAGRRDPLVPVTAPLSVSAGADPLVYRYNYLWESGVVSLG
ncbi:phage GP46 family protein [bacterium]|nr:phage GP46 family protein [bacterium]